MRSLAELGPIIADQTVSFLGRRVPAGRLRVSDAMTHWTTKKEREGERATIREREAGAEWGVAAFCSSVSRRPYGRAMLQLARTQKLNLDEKSPARSRKFKAVQSL